jgi:hypothetical protein
MDAQSQRRTKIIVFLCDSKFWAWQLILEKYTNKSLWSDQDLRTLLSFTPPKFRINPRYNISPPQLLACCLLGVQTANNLLFHQQTAIHLIRVFL